MKAKGFTLIELLVVITIIGILATGATALYTGSQEKARDSVRISDVQIIKGALEQSYGDENKYPTADATASTGTIGTLISRKYMLSGPVDAKAGQVYNGTALNYTYSPADSAGGTSGYRQLYEVSTGFEATGNVGATLRTGTDGGEDNTRFELNNGTGVITTLDTDGTTLGTNTVDGTASTDAVILPAS